MDDNWVSLSTVCKLANQFSFFLADPVHVYSITRTSALPHHLGFGSSPLTVPDMGFRVSNRIAPYLIGQMM
jgi:hypothetical protein